MSQAVALGVIGGGVMAEAIVSCLLAQKVYQAETVLIGEPQSQRRQYWQEKYGVAVTVDNNQVMQAEAILLAVKPQILDKVVATLKWEANPLILSILAGVTLEKLELAFPNCPVVRIIPNTPATVGAAMSAISPSSQVTEVQLAISHKIFAAVREVVTVPEYQMNAVTGLSGSGPAYVALMVEALADGGVAAGLPRAISQKLAIQTVLGTAQLLKETELHPAVLKDRVSSPGGTTIAGVSALEKAGFRSAAINAVQAAYQRSKELGE